MSTNIIIDNYYVDLISTLKGFATESARLGASMPAIQRHGRWRSTKTVVEYIEAGRQFEDSAVNVLFADAAGSKF